MKYQSALEKAAIVSKRTMENSEIKKTKRKLIISISIESFIMLIYLILQVGLLNFEEFEHRRGVFIESFLTIISIIYLIIYLIVITRYFPKGIWIFAWVTLIQLIGGLILFILAIMGIVISLSLIHIVGADIIIDVLFTIVGVSIIILSVLIIIYSLNLIKLMKTS